MTLETASQPSTPTPATPTPLVGALILAALAVAAGVYIYLNVAVLGNRNYWAGFLFLTFWMAAEQMKPGAFTSCAAGAVAGTLLALALQMLPQAYGVTGQSIGLALVLIAIYMQIVGWAKIAINFSTMIFLTAGAAVPIQANVRIIDVLPPLALGIVFFGALILGAQKIAERRAAPTPAT